MGCHFELSGTRGVGAGEALRLIQRMGQKVKHFIGTKTVQDLRDDKGLLEVAATLMRCEPGAIETRLANESGGQQLKSALAAQWPDREIDLYNEFRVASLRKDSGLLKALSGLLEIDEDLIVESLRSVSGNTKFKNIDMRSLRKALLKRRRGKIGQGSPSPEHVVEADSLESHYLRHSRWNEQALPCWDLYLRMEVGVDGLLVELSPICPPMIHWISDIEFELSLCEAENLKQLAGAHGFEDDQGFFAIRALRSNRGHFHLFIPFGAASLGDCCDLSIVIQVKFSERDTEFFEFPCPSLPNVRFSRAAFFRPLIRLALIFAACDGPINDKERTALREGLRRGFGFLPSDDRDLKELIDALLLSYDQNTLDSSAGYSTEINESIADLATRIYGLSSRQLASLFNARSEDFVGASSRSAWIGRSLLALLELIARSDSPSLHSNEGASLATCEALFGL